MINQIQLQISYDIIDIYALPIMYPNPKNIWVQDITEATLSGYNAMRMDVTEFHAAVS